MTHSEFTVTVLKPEHIRISSRCIENPHDLLTGRLNLGLDPRRGHIETIYRQKVRTCQNDKYRTNKRPVEIKFPD